MGLQNSCLMLVKASAMQSSRARRPRLMVWSICIWGAFLT